MIPTAMTNPSAVLAKYMTAGPEHHADRAQVVRSTRHEVARPVALQVGLRQPLQVGEKIVPEVIFHLTRCADKVNAHQVAETAVGERQRKNGPGVTHQTRPVDSLGQPVNDVFQDPGRREREGRGSENACQADDERPPDTNDVRQQARERPNHGGSIAMRISPQRPLRTPLPPRRCGSRPSCCRCQRWPPRSTARRSSAPAFPRSSTTSKFAGTIWNPGLQASSRASVSASSAATSISSTTSGFEQTSFKDMRIVLRPSKKSRFRIQYTPIEYQAETTLKRDIVFNGQKFPVSLPLQSELDWKVWRFGYEYDFFYRERGFVGVLLEGRVHADDRRAVLAAMSESTQVSAPLPAIGIVGRAYPIPEVAVNFEVSMFRVPEDSIPDVEANYYDWDIYGTINLHRNVGLQVGWRRMTNFLVDRGRQRRREVPGSVVRRR